MTALRAGWLEQREEGVLRRAALAPLGGLASVYGLGARADRALYEHGPRSVVRLGCQVVAVGSPLVGGTGKTPLCAWVARALRAQGRRVAIASRGYGRSGAGVEVVSDGKRICTSPGRAGDEALWLAASLPGVPVVVARDRADAGRRAIALFGADVLVLDDGLQHHRLQRDLTIATLDAEFGLGNGRVLPRGPLREPLGALARADALAVVGPRGGSLPAPDAERIDAAAPGLMRFSIERSVRGVRPIGVRDVLPASTLAGLEVGVLCAIARPDSVVRSLEEAGSKVVALRSFRDHYRFRAADLDGLEAQASIWVTTEKDAVKLRSSWAQTIDLRVLAIRVAPSSPRHFSDWLEQGLVAGHR